MSAVTKRIILPVYKDWKNTEGWENKYTNSPNFSVVVYEKDDSLKFGEHEKTKSGFKIPNIGRSSFSFLYHICEHYDSLFDVEIFTKTHVRRQQILIHESIDACENYEHFQLWNRIRFCAYVRDNIFDELKDFWISSCNPSRVEDTCLEFSGGMLESLKLDSGIGPHVLDGPRPAVLYVYRNEKHDRARLARMSEIFPNYTEPEIDIFRREMVWSVKKELILYHPKSLYLDILNKVASGDEDWTFCHDHWGEFWPAFWNETLRRMK